jgi:hypothetical protein
VPHCPQLSVSVDVLVHVERHIDCPSGHEHWPPTHEDPPEHTMLHSPQFQLSDCVSMQVPWQYVRSDVHRATHSPLVHVLSRGQAIPHAVQFWSSFRRSAQLVPQAVSPGPHLHMPLSQWVSPWHAMPHAPQFASFVSVMTQAPPHTVCPEGHCDTHAPCRQISPLWHAMPHAPQFMASDMGSLQVTPHSILGLLQTQRPFWHVMPMSQVEPQPPQLPGSLEMSTHAVSQKVRPAVGQAFWQTPATHDEPAGQAPQVPLEALAFAEGSFDPQPAPTVKAIAASTRLTASADERTRLCEGFGMTRPSS